MSRRRGLKLALALASVFVLDLGLTPRAHAGGECGNFAWPEALRELERYGDGKHTELFELRCLDGEWRDRLSASDTERVLAACKKAVTLAKKARLDELDRFCVNAVAANGTSKVGDRDLVGELIATPGAAWNHWPPYRVVAQSGDPRARSFVLDQFAKHRASWRKKKLSAAWAVDLWTKHELEVLAALAAVGTHDDLALIDEVSAENPKTKPIQAGVKLARDAAAKR